MSDKLNESMSTDGDQWWCKACRWKGRRANLDTDEWVMKCPECFTRLSVSVDEGAELLNE